MLKRGLVDKSECGQGGYETLYSTGTTRGKAVGK